MSASDSSPVSAAKPTSPVPSLFRAASVIAVFTVLSKVLGLVRDQMIAHAYGASLVSDAYLYAFQIPSFCLVLLGGMGGPFHTTTVSILSKLVTDATKPPDENAQRVTNTFITLTILIFGLLSVLTFWFAEPIIGLLAAQAPPEMKAIAAQQLRWMSPMIVIGGIVGIFYGVANVYHKFLWPAIAPSGINITLILWLLIRGADAAGDALAISTLLGAILQFLMQLPDFFGSGFRFFPAFDVKSPDVRTMGELLFPATIGTTIGQLNIFVAMFFVSQLDSGAWTANILGNRLIQLPLGVLTIAMLVPLFPRMSRYVAENNLDALRSDFREGILSLWLLSVPVVALILLVGEQGVRLLFERGAFIPRDTALVTTVLVVMAFSILPYMLRDGMTRIFYAFNDSRTPLFSGIITLVINGVLNALLVKPMGVMGLALSSTIATICNAVLLSILVRKHLLEPGLKQFINPTARMILAGLIAGMLTWFGLTLLQSNLSLLGLLPESIWVALIEILLAMVMLGPVYFFLLLLFRVNMAHRALNKLLRRA